MATVLVAAVAGCDAALPFQVEPSPVPRARPDALAPADIPERSAASRSLSRYYARIETQLRDNGLLRVDVDGRDVPFTERNLVENFVQIALFQEYTETAERFVSRETPSKLRRWEAPVRVRLFFDPTVDDATQARDRENVRAYLGRMQRLTGRSVRLVDNDTANFFLLIQTRDGLATSGEKLRRLVPGIGQVTVREITEMPRQTYCAVYAFPASATPNVYVSAIAVIRAEHPETLKLSCIQEEIAQGLGLPNDSPAARPSIFNDDEEFALLTRHDEYLLRMLYDPRMRPGMTAQDARPVAEVIAAELLRGEG